MNLASAANFGYRFRTESSSKWGTVTNLTSFSGRKAFRSFRTLFRMSLFMFEDGGRYNCRLSLNYIGMNGGGDGTYVSLEVVLGAEPVAELGGREGIPGLHRG